MSVDDIFAQPNKEDAPHSRVVAEELALTAESEAESLSIEPVEQDPSVVIQGAISFRWRLDLLHLEGPTLVTIGSEYRIRWIPSKTTMKLHQRTVTLQLDAKVFHIYLILLISRRHSVTIACRLTTPFSSITAWQCGLVIPVDEFSLCGCGKDFR